MSDVLIREVGLRDGLQLVKNILPTEKKINWLNNVKKKYNSHYSCKGK